jgi:EEF1A lysine methyltransferase 2
MNSTKKHWDSIFSISDEHKLGWYETDMSITYKLLDVIPNWEKSTIFLPGVGTSALAEELNNSGVKLVLNDISNKALNLVRERLSDNVKQTTWLCQDIAKPISEKIPKVDIWLDRAVLHFLTDENAITGYFNNLHSVLNKNGYAFFAEFSTTGVTKCAGLDVHRYSFTELTEKLGPSFKLLSSFDHTYFTPNGDPRPYLYTLFQKKSEP